MKLQLSKFIPIIIILKPLNNQKFALLAIPILISLLVIPTGLAHAGGFCIVGTEGNDKFSGTDANDCFEGLAGNDKIQVGDGSDVVAPGDGKERPRARAGP